MTSQEEQELHALKCQYFQLVEPRALTLPPASLLSHPSFQERLYNSLFSPDSTKYPPPERYTCRVLKRLVEEIESNAEEINSDLLELYTTLLARPLPRANPTEKSHVTYTLPRPYAPITLLETPHLISGLGTTGLRTWEAALALSEVLIAAPPAPGTRILELGAGTGLVGLVAARLGADVRMTDGDAGVVEALQRNVEINEMGGKKVRCAVRRWAGPRECPEEKVDWVLGADVTYDQEAIPWLVAELRWCFAENPGVRVTIAATVRNVDTWAAFGRCCEEAGLRTEEKVYELPQPRVFWYVPRAEIRIVEVFKK